MPVVRAVVVGRERRVVVVLPESRPHASGTRAMMPTPASAAAGSTASSGFRRKALKMICTVATSGRAMAVRASSAVLDADAVGRDRLVLDERVERVEDGVVVRRPAVGGQCSCTRSSVSTPRFVRERSVQARKFVGRVVLGRLVDAAAHLGGDHEVEVGVRGAEPADQLLAAAVAIDVGGVEEGDAGLDRGVEHRQGVVFARRRPSRRRAARCRDR